MQTAIVENTKATHVDVPLPSRNILELSVSMNFAPSRVKKTVFVFFTLEGIQNPWKSEAVEVVLSKKPVRISRKILPMAQFEERKGIAPHLCICILDEEKKHFKSTVQWSLEAEF
ncbi:hypothetical protein [Brazilian marseillevirus]|uniref:hypothetical protein n=1 Tax=Brazilian marseillevirus TaxID=1813599 RepID=UPI000785CA28|nr:hypothetical protein A3303_gp270 [Brazilian marseillevirus]AMQ10778.1 hypothetical protein [Brazilian marseillevirus]